MRPLPSTEALPGVPFPGLSAPPRSLSGDTPACRERAVTALVFSSDSLEWLRLAARPGRLGFWAGRGRLAALPKPLCWVGLLSPQPHPRPDPPLSRPHCCSWCRAVWAPPLLDSALSPPPPRTLPPRRAILGKWLPLLQPGLSLLTAYTQHTHLGLAVWAWADLEGN